MFSISNDVEVANNWTALSSIDYKFTQEDKISPSFFHEYRKNIQYKIKHSHKFFFGLKVQPFDKKKNYSLHAGLGYEFTRYNGNTFENSIKVDALRKFEMAVFRIKNNHILFDKKLLINYDVFFIQSFREVQDYTFRFVTGINIPLKKGVVVGMAYDFRFRNVHLIDTSQHNDLLSFNFTFGFE